jgi:hypothetical protein
MVFRLLISALTVSALTLAWVDAQDTPKSKKKARKEKSVPSAPVLPETPPMPTVQEPAPPPPAPAVTDVPAPAPEGIARVEGPSIHFEKTRHTFGKVKQGDLVKHSFRFTNNGSVDLKISEVKASCGCTVPSWPKNPLKPGESGIIDVKFNTAGKMGKQKKSVTVYSNVGEPPNNFTVLYLEGEVSSPTLPTIEIR